MRRVISPLVCALAAWAACASVLAASARAQDPISYGPCPETNEFGCGKLTVPLDPDGTVPGTITLSIRRHLAPTGNAKTAVIALAGGPGQAANPFAGFFAELLGPIISTRDLIVFDQRGTGDSSPLKCPELEEPGVSASTRATIEGCAHQIGAARAFYTTADSVADIEAIREAGGYEKLVLYGTSYGTKVALQFAQDHPEQVEALVLDSVVTPNGPEQLMRSTLKAVPRILRQLCSAGECAHITHNPVRDLRRLVARMRDKPLRSRIVGPNGKVHELSISSAELLNILIAGDLEPFLRAEFPAAVRAALGDDDAPLARMVYRGLYGPEEESSGIDVPLYYATTCEEQTFPWQRSSSPRRRLREARARARSIPAATLGPFTSQDVLEVSDIPDCAFWPFASSSPLTDDAPLPEVPTLILSGADDLRTPTAEARKLAARIPGSHLVVVPHVGHSVLGTDPSSCSRDALQALFDGKPIESCKPERPSSALRPVPLAPDRLSAVSPTRGQSGRTGRTLHAVTLTLSDFIREMSLRLSTGDAADGLRTGGLRAGWARDSAGAIQFHDYSYVPGVTISGALDLGRATLRVGGRAAARGTLHLSASGRLEGILDGRRVSLAGISGDKVAASTASVASVRAATSILDSPLGEPSFPLMRD